MHKKYNDIDVHDESLTPDLFLGSQADPDPAADRADRLPPAKQPDGVLVHGGLGPPKLPGEQDGVLKHVRETHSKW